MPSPAGYPVFLEDRKQPKFRGLVSLPTDAGHYLLAGLVEHEDLNQFTDIFRLSPNSRSRLAGFIFMTQKWFHIPGLHAIVSPRIGSVPIGIQQPS